MPPRRASRPAPPCAPRRRWGTRTPRSPFLARSRAPAGSTGSRCQVAPPRQVCRPAPPRAPRRRRGTMTPHSPFRLGRSRAPPARPRRRGGRRGRLHSSAPRRRRAADCRFSRSTLSGPAATPKLRRSPPTLQQPLPCRATAKLFRGGILDGELRSEGKSSSSGALDSCRRRRATGPLGGGEADGGQAW